MYCSVLQCVAVCVAVSIMELTCNEANFTCIALCRNAIQSWLDMYCSVFRCTKKLISNVLNRVAMYYCSVLQCVAVCCSVLQCVEPCCSVLQCVEPCCNVLFSCLHMCCSVLQCNIELIRHVLQCVAVCCSVLQCVAVCCSVCCSECYRADLQSSWLQTCCIVL